MQSIEQILERDPKLKSEIVEILEAGGNLPVAKRNNVHWASIQKAMVGPVADLPSEERKKRKSVLSRLSETPLADEMIAPTGQLAEMARSEAMIRLHLRPALLIKNNKIFLPESAEIRNRFLPYLKKVEHVVPAVGRVEFVNLGKKFGGTGWLVTKDLIVTNRHVAALASETKKPFRLKRNALGTSIEIVVDFKEEFWGPGVAAPEFEIQIEKVAYMTPHTKSQPDIAFLKIRPGASGLAEPIVISDRDVKERQFVSVIGYPAYDPSGIINEAAAKNTFNNVYDVKRCAPGEIIENVNNAWYFFHDCTTLGGNSGSVVLDNETGTAIGLHFMGDVGIENYAVKGKEIIKHLRKVDLKFPVSSGTVTKPRVTIGGKKLESPPASYSDREGYKPEFLGANALVPLPTVKRRKQDVLTFEYMGKKAAELKYHHFSVLMNRARRLCFFSACNIDGKESKRGVARTGWKYDSRIPLDLQIKEECYGNPPQFSRGHMTRKEDPIWGDLNLARVAAADTFHVTNAVPQMQMFNAPVWLALEDYALENARQDYMRITVITGPIFDETDPVRDGVQIPLDFFKIIAFIHDDTKVLTATGYTTSQSSFIKSEEFVFGEFETYQVSLKSIETRTGLSFGNLPEVDPIKGEEAFGAPLTSVEEMRFF
jgi:endonuclease G